MAETYVIAGGGTAAANAAESLRGDGFDGRIVVIGSEAHAPYERPPLSKTLLRGELEPAAVALRAPEFYEKNRIELRPETRVLELDLSKRSVRCSDGQDVRFDKLLIATGATPRRLGVSGELLDGVHAFRTLDDAFAVRAQLGKHPRVVVVGTGFIGCEVAAAARQVGCDVTLVGPSAPMAHALGKEVAALYADRHLANGVTLKVGPTVKEFRGSGSVESALLSDGNEVACDVAVVGVGVVPEIGWLGSGVAISDGVDTDELCRTNVPGIFAAGDVACSWRPRLNRRVRLEHFDNANHKAPRAAKQCTAARVRTIRFRSFGPTNSISRCSIMASRATGIGWSFVIMPPTIRSLRFTSKTGAWMPHARSTGRRTQMRSSASSVQPALAMRT